MEKIMTAEYRGKQLNDKPLYNNQTQELWL